MFKVAVILFKAPAILFKVPRIDLVQHVDLVQGASLSDAAVANGARVGDTGRWPHYNAVSRVFNPRTILFKVPSILFKVPRRGAATPGSAVPMRAGDLQTDAVTGGTNTRSADMKIAYRGCEPPTPWAGQDDHWPLGVGRDGPRRAD